MEKSVINEALVAKLLEDDQIQKAKIRRLEQSVRTMESALDEIANFKWFSWSVDYSPKSIALRALNNHSQLPDS